MFMMSARRLQAKNTATITSSIVVVLRSFDFAVTAVVVAVERRCENMPRTLPLALRIDSRGLLSVNVLALFTV